MKVNPSKEKDTLQPPKRKVRQQSYYLTRLKFKSLLRTPSIKVGSLLSGLSVLLIISPLLFKQKFSWFDIWQNLGFNLLGAVCAFVAFDIVFIHLKQLDKQQGVKLDFFDKSEFINRVRESKALNRFSFQPMVTVRILETWTELLRDNNYRESFSQAILSCLENNKHEIEILLLNPGNRDLVEARSEDLKSISDDYNDTKILENVYVNFREIQKILEKLKSTGNQNRLKVKCYNTVPSFAMYMCAPHLFVTFFRSGKLTTMSEQLKLHIDSPVSAFINQRFEEIWQDAKTISLENCLYVTLDVIQSGKFQATYDKVKYIFCDQGYYLQNRHLFLDIANRRDINIRIDGKFFKPRGVAMDDLPANVKDFFSSKYIDNGELFIFLESLN